MTGKYQAYPKYKDLGTDWMGMVPGNWDSIAIGRLFTRVKRTDHVDKELLSVYRDHGVVPKSSRDDNNNKPSDDLAPYQLVQPNDLVLNKMKTWQGSIAISEYEGIVSPAYFVYKPNAELFTKAHPKYIHYLLRNPLYIAQYLSRSKGIRVNQWDLDPDEFKCIELLLPSKDEQSTIIKFLDHETAKIDTLIDKQQQLIKLLKEKRQAVISHAVTKGLNPHVPMKDSGVEWLGEVPEHWEVVQLGKKIQLQRGVDITKDVQDEGEVPVISSGGISSFHSSAICEGPGVLVGRKGAAGKMHYVESSYWPHDTTLYVSEFRGNNPRFVYYKLLSMNLETYDTGSANPTLNRNVIHPEKVSWPGSQEQIQISGYLDELSVTMDKLVGKATTAISILQERRTALISAAVTGKIDVRNWQPPQSETPMEASA